MAKLTSDLYYKLTEIVHKRHFYWRQTHSAQEIRVTLTLWTVSTLPLTSRHLQALPTHSSFQSS